MYIPAVKGFISCIYHLQNVIYIHNKKSLAFLSLFNAETFANCYCCIIFPRITISPFLPPHPHQTSLDSFDLIPFRSCSLYSITTYFYYTHIPTSQPEFQLHFWDYTRQFILTLHALEAKCSPIHHCNPTLGSIHSIRKNI